MVSRFRWHDWQSVLILCTCFALLSAESHAAELKQEALKRWDSYVQTANSQIRDRLKSGGTFLWVDEAPDRVRRVRAGKILVSPAEPHIPRPVPSGLIHDWIGAAFIPNTKLADVLAVVRNYDHYQDYYKPSVVESKSLTAQGDEDRFTMVLVNREVVAKTALDGEYQACYQKVDDAHWYGIAYTTRIQEIRDYGHPEEKKLAPDEGSGYIWRLYSITRFAERDGGVYVELEAMALSRDIPVALRWMVDPIVRRVSKNAVTTSLHQTEEALHSEDIVPAVRLTSASDCESAMLSTK